MDKKKNRSLNIIDSLSPKDIDFDAPRARRAPKPRTIHSPQTSSDYNKAIQSDRLGKAKAKIKSKNELKPPKIVSIRVDGHVMKYTDKDEDVMDISESIDGFSVLSASDPNELNNKGELQTIAHFTRNIKRKTHDLEVDLQHLEPNNHGEDEDSTTTTVVNIVEYENILVSLNQAKEELQELKDENKKLNEIHESKIKELKMTVEMLTNANKILLQEKNESCAKIKTLELKDDEVKKKLKGLEILILKSKQEDEKSQMTRSKNLLPTSNHVNPIPFQHPNYYNHQMMQFPHQMPYSPPYYNNNYHLPPTYGQNLGKTMSSPPPQSQTQPKQQMADVVSRMQAMLADHQAVILNMLKNSDNQSLSTSSR